MNIENSGIYGFRFQTSYTALLYDTYIKVKVSMLTRFLAGIFR